MKFNPITKELFTDNNLLIKKLECPFNIKWSDLSLTTTYGVRSCNLCKNTITDTDALTDKVVVEIVKLDANICLKVNLNQLNIRMVNHNLLG